LILCKQRQNCGDLQLLGVSALYTAMKIEEVELKTAVSFSNYTGRTYSPKQIALKEREIVFAMNWCLNPDTLYSWLNSLCDSWDSYIVSVPHKFDLSLVKTFKKDHDNMLLNPLTHPFSCFSLRNPNRFRLVL
jgi:hypothetical protein